MCVNYSPTRKELLEDFLGVSLDDTPDWPQETWKDYLAPFVHHDEGTPDGLAVDSAGNVWVALNGAGRVRCHSPQGDVLAEVVLPVRLVTSCTFGGDDLRDLYVTTSREDLEHPEPQAGALFRVRVSVPGQPVRAFAG